jgi:hypothetical protein
MLKLVRAAAFVTVLAFPAAAFAAGAIAVDDVEGMEHHETGFGTAINEANGDEAAAAAMRECRSTGNENCRVVLRFNKCGAYAVSRDHFGVGTGRTQRAAERDALDGCGAGCRVAVSECE